MKKWIFIFGILAAMSVYSQNQVSITPDDHYNKLANTDLSYGYPTEEEKELYLNEITFQQGVQSYLWALPAVNMWSMKEASEKAMGAGYNVFPIWAERMTANTLIPTPNDDVIYAMKYVDLKADGPLVVEVPAGIQGLFDDFWQRPIESHHNGKTWYGDVGLVGPDEGKGGNFLLLPPDYKGDVPEGYYVYRSRTYNVFIFWRAFYKDPNNLKPAVDLIKTTKIYPLGQKSTAKPMKFPNATKLKLNMLFPKDGTYFETLSRFINAEYVDPEDMYMRGMLAAIGIEKGKAFKPDEKTKELLNKAALTGNKMSKVLSSTKVYDEGKVYKDGNATNTFIEQNPWFQASGTYTNVNFRASYFTSAYATSPGMTTDMLEKGAKYPSFMKDSDSNYLDGSNTYIFHVPANPPAKIFWSVSIYDPTTGSGLDNGQKFFSLNSMDKLEQNADVSWDFYFGPTDPGKKNWLKTVPDKGFIISFRLYGPMQSYFDQTWKIGDPKKIK